MIRRQRSEINTGNQLAASFFSVCETLSKVASEEHLETLLSDWVVPADRRLPQVFMNWTIRQLLATPFEQLSGTPGVGRKKIESLIHLLNRVAAPPSHVQRTSMVAPVQGTISAAPVDANINPIDYFQVSETVWAEWRQRVIEYGLDQETLGRFAPSLQPLSRVIWHKPLGFYTPLTLAEIRAQKTYGEKRVRAVLEVFGALQSKLGSAKSSADPFAQCPFAECQPQCIRGLNDWMRGAVSRDGRVSADEIRNSLVEPLVLQIEIDGGAALADLARHRLGFYGQVESVLRAARRLGYMRARVYQLLNEMASIVAVRWPEGIDLARRLDAKLRSRGDASTSLPPFEAARDLFFPELREELTPPASSGHSVPTIPTTAIPPVDIFSSASLEHNPIHSQLA